MSPPVLPRIWVPRKQHEEKGPSHPPWLPELGQEAEPADAPGQHWGCGLRKARRVEDRPQVQGLCWRQAGSVSRRGHCILEPRSCPPAHLLAGKGGGLSSDLRSMRLVSALGPAPHHQLRVGHRFSTWSAPKAAFPSQI